MRVLLIEDTTGLGEAVRDQIRDDGHAVDWVQSLNFAQASVQTTSYNLILLDLMLPDGNGFDFLKALENLETQRPLSFLPLAIRYRIELKD
ncbi:response regulator [Marinomonas sp. KJ51-3]|uniref:Response regulator n=1 Tax=Marinomonas rhodophyticola TaxID=2992803 RepID=A0ABT3KKB8_9GAMM|nr:response regulator [Marinomonas sp. KJ51-3]MCW4630482.1 response regulator [Marinomonas sp. KJ51-3]